MHIPLVLVQMVLPLEPGCASSIAPGKIAVKQYDVLSVHAHAVSCEISGALERRVATIATAGMLHFIAGRGSGAVWAGSPAAATGFGSRALELASLAGSASSCGHRERGGLKRVLVERLGQEGIIRVKSKMVVLLNVVCRKLVCSCHMTSAGASVVLTLSCWQRSELICAHCRSGHVRREYVVEVRILTERGRRGVLHRERALWTVWLGIFCSSLGSYIRVVRDVTVDKVRSRTVGLSTLAEGVPRAL